MIPPEFDYVAPDTLDEALSALRGTEDAKILAGGHSLLPLMKLRLAAPTLLVDIRKVPGLRGVQRENGQWRMGALTRHADIQGNADLGPVGKAAALIADQQVRNRGTIAASPAVLNAVVDALRPLGVTYINMPLGPMRVWEAIQEAKR